MEGDRYGVAGVTDSKEDRISNSLGTRKWACSTDENPQQQLAQCPHVSRVLLKHVCMCVCLCECAYMCSYMSAYICEHCARVHT